MGLLGFDAGEATEPELPEAGVCHVMIKSAKYVVSENTGRGYFNITLISQDDPKASPIWHKLFCGKDEDPETTTHMFDLAVQKFCKGFECGFDVFDDEESLKELVGSEANAIIKHEKNKEMDRMDAVCKSFEPL